MTSWIRPVYERLFAHYGPQRWWPGDTPLEIIVGAVLTHNTNWRNVERAIQNLRAECALEPRALLALDAEELAELIRPAGYYRVKAGRLRNVMRMIVEEYDGSLDVMFATPQDELRRRLLQVNGVGAETADCILLYAGQLPSFVIDAYTQRVVKRHGWIEFEADYHALQETFESGLPREAALYNEYHALLVQVGKDFCGPTPRCEKCPLAPLLPAGGPLSPEF